MRPRGIAEAAAKDGIIFHLLWPDDGKAPNEKGKKRKRGEGKKKKGKERNIPPMTTANRAERAGLADTLAGFFSFPILSGPIVN